MRAPRFALPLALSALSLAPPLAAASPDLTASTRPAWRIYGENDGIPQNTVHAIALDTHGELWIGTQDGAARYDGRKWREVRLPGRANTAQVRAILATSDGSLWFGTQSGGVARRRDGAWQAFTVASGALPHDRVNSLAETTDAAGHPVLWVGTFGGGLARFAEGRWTRVDERSGLPDLRVWSLLVTRDATGNSSLWVATESGLAVLRPGATRFALADGFPTQPVTSIAETSDERGARVLWVGTFGHGLWRFDGAGWKALGIADGLPSEFVTSLFAGRSKATRRALWIGTDGGGLARLVDGEMTRFDRSIGLPSPAVYSLFETTEQEGAQALWIGTRGAGLVRLKEGRWRGLEPRADGQSVAVNAITELRGGSGASTIWLGTDGNGLLTFVDGAWRTLRASPGGLPGDTIQCLLATAPAGDGETAAGQVLWIGTRHAGLARLLGGRFTRFDKLSGALPNDLVQTLLETAEDDGSRALWVGTRGGLVIHAKGTWRTLGPAPGKPEGPVLALATSVSSAGRRVLWVGTASGLGRLEAGAWRTLDSRSGLPGDFVQALRVTREPHPGLWLGTGGGGIARIDLADESASPRVLDTTSVPPLPNDLIYSILEDSQGRIYVVHNRGVARLTHRLDAPHGEPAYDLFNFTHEDGLPIDQGSLGSGFVDSAGRVWVGTAAGAAVLDPAHEVPDRTPKRLVLHASVESDASRPLASGERLAHDRNHLAFTFALLSFFREGSTRYRTQLDGLEEEPSPWQATSERDLSALPPGSYTFRVWGRDYAGNVSGPIALPFSIAPPWWEAWWARSTVGALLALLVAALLRSRLERHERRERELTRVVEARTRQLREAHDLLVSLSYVDALTSVANRRRFDEVLEQEWRRAVRLQGPISLLLIDIDCFKAFNDTYGHQLGDDCLRQVARALDDALLRAGDVVGRYGGEEFGVILPGTDLSGALALAEQLRARVEALGLENRASTVAAVVTLSCGAATRVPTLADEPRELVHCADVALYRAKQRGRNRVECYSESGEVVLAGLGMRPVARPDPKR